MKQNLERRWKNLQRQLDSLAKQAKKARGETRDRVGRLERQTRAAVERALRVTEPKVRRAVADATRYGRGLRAGMKAGAAAYRASVRKK